MNKFVQSAFTLLTLLCVPSLLWAAAIGPKIEQWQSKKGARVYYVPAPELPMVDIRIVFDAGSARNGAKAGLSILTNGMLSEGAGKLDATAIAKRFEGLGARFSNAALRDMAVVSLRSLSEDKFLRPATELMALVLGQPTFPEKSLARERNRALIALQSQRDALDDLTDIAFMRGIYGDHPYAEQPLGREETIKTIQRADLIAFYKQYYVAKNTVIAIVGAIDRARAEAIADELMAPLAEGTPAAPLPTVKALDAARTIRVNQVSTQTHLMVGQPGMRRDDPDYFALLVGNHVLGGSGLVSRMAEEIREKRGLSYSQYSAFSPMRMDGPFTMGLQTRNDQAEQALALLTQLLREFIEKGPTDAELVAAKKNITGSFPLRIASNSNIVEYLSMIGFYGLPLDYLDTYNARVEAITADAIRDAFKRRIKPDALITVVAGGSAPAAPVLPVTPPATAPAAVNGDNKG